MISHIWFKIVGVLAFLGTAALGMFYRERAKRHKERAERSDSDLRVHRKATDAATKLNEGKYDAVDKARRGDFSGLSDD